MYKTPDTDRLWQMLESQRDLQKSMPPFRQDPSALQGVERIQFFKDMKLALEAELQEMLDEMGWKPWATSHHFDTAAVRGEIIDAWHFLMNLWLATGGDADQFFQGYTVKREKNLQRQQAKGGYDGVSTKCPQCKRALDDDAVKCHLPKEKGSKGVGWCDRHEQIYYYEEDGNVVVRG